MVIVGNAPEIGTSKPKSQSRACSPMQCDIQLTPGRMTFTALVYVAGTSRNKYYTFAGLLLVLAARCFYLRVDLMLGLRTEGEAELAVSLPGACSVGGGDENLVENSTIELSRKNEETTKTIEGLEIRIYHR